MQTKNDQTVVFAAGWGNSWALPPGSWRTTCTSHPLCDLFQQYHFHLPAYNMHFLLYFSLLHKSMDFPLGSIMKIRQNDFLVKSLGFLCRQLALYWTVWALAYVNMYQNVVWLIIHPPASLMHEKNVKVWQPFSGLTCFSYSAVCVERSKLNSTLTKELWKWINFKFAFKNYEFSNWNEKFKHGDAHF